MSSRGLAGPHPATAAAAAAAATADVWSAHKVANVTQARPSRVTESCILSSCRLVPVGLDEASKKRCKEELLRSADLRCA